MFQFIFSLKGLPVLVLMLLVAGCLGGSPEDELGSSPAIQPVAASSPTPPESKQFYAYTNAITCEALIASLNTKDGRENSLRMVGAFLTGVNYAKGRMAPANLNTLNLVAEDYCRNNPKKTFTEALIVLDRSVDVIKTSGPPVQATDSPTQVSRNVTRGTQQSPLNVYKPASSLSAAKASPGEKTTPQTVVQGTTNSPGRVLQVQPSARQSTPVAGAQQSPSLATAGEKFVVQIFASQDRKEAEVYYSKLKALSTLAQLERMDMGAKGLWYRVYTGPYSSQPAAEKVKGLLEKAGHKGFVRKM